MSASVPSSRNPAYPLPLGLNPWQERLLDLFRACSLHLFMHTSTPNPTLNDSMNNLAEYARLGNLRLWLPGDTMLGFREGTIAIRLTMRADEQLGKGNELPCLSVVRQATLNTNPGARQEAKAAFARNKKMSSKRQGKQPQLPRQTTSTRLQPMCQDDQVLRTHRLCEDVDLGKHHHMWLLVAFLLFDKQRGTHHHPDEAKYWQAWTEHILDKVCLWPVKESDDKWTPEDFLSGWKGEVNNALHLSNNVTTGNGSATNLIWTGRIPLTPVLTLQVHPTLVETVEKSIKWGYKARIRQRLSQQKARALDKMSRVPLP